MSDRIFKFSDTLTFGKYKGEIIRKILRNDPEYLDWAIATIPWFKMSDDDVDKILVAIENLSGPYDDIPYEIDEYDYVD